jgi:hypothetical protein
LDFQQSPRFFFTNDWRGLTDAAAPAPGASTSQGRPYSIFRRALERKNLLVAEATAKELPPLNLSDALELTMLIARKDPRRQPEASHSAHSRMRPTLWALTGAQSRTSSLCH